MSSTVQTVTQKFIESVWQSADDQIASQYRLTVTGFEGGNFLASSPDSWIFRLDKSFTVPTQTTSTYDIYFNGLKIPKVSAKEETEKKIKLDFRSDQASDIYTYFKKWIDQGYDPLFGYMEDENITRKNKNIKMELLNRSVAKSTEFSTTTSQIQKTFTFYHCQPYEINISELSHESGEPVRVELQFVYIYYTVN